MLKYLIIPLANDAVSFCHYKGGNQSDGLTDINTLKKAIFWAMTENLNVQFVYPYREIPSEYKAVIDTIDHAKIVSSDCEDRLLTDEADIVVFDGWNNVDEFKCQAGKSYVIRTTRSELFDNANTIKRLLPELDRLVIVITDIDKFEDTDIEKYESFLDSMIPVVKEEYGKGHQLHFNLLTDRIFLDNMNNCNAGHESITLAPDGKFYICPAFYLDGSKPVGDLENGPDIKNQQLYRLDHAPICRKCDAWQCRRCIWLNRRTTLEVNTPSHQQCVVAHIERNASRKLLDEIRTLGEFCPGKEIKEIDYLDPFEIMNI